jgi:uncharacterized protein
MVKTILIFFGTLSLCLGLAGIFIPGLPTTPFLLLTAGLYLRSSQRLYQLLLNNKYVGPYILKFKVNKGMSRNQKIYSISLMWAMIFISTLFFLSIIILKWILIALGITGTIVMGLVIPTANNNK